MHQSTLGLAAILMFGGTVIAQAQDGPRDRLPSAAPGVESGGSPDAGGGGSSGNEGPGAASAPGERAEGPPPDVRKGAPEGESSGAVREDKGQRDDRPLRPRANKADGNKASRNAENGGKGADRKGRADAHDASPEKSAQDRKAKGSDRKSAEDRGDRGKEARDADKARADKDAGSSKADRDQADRGSAGAASKQAEGDRKPPEDVKKADLSGQKRERVETAFRESRDVKRRTDVDINISVGTRLPRDWHFVPVPVAVVEVVPEYRGYVFAYVEDEYVICDPVTYEVVAVLPASGGGARHVAGGGPADRCSTTLTLTNDEREDILRSIQFTDEVDASNVTVGWSVPGDIELRTFPEPILSRSEQLAACRYFVADDQIAIVDPAEETVVLLIDHE